MLHVVHVLHSLGTGGMEGGLVKLVRALPEMQHTVIAMAGSGPIAAELPPRAPLFCLHKRPGKDAAAAIALARLLRRLRPAIVHSRNWGAFDAVLVARLSGVRHVVHSEHGREASDPLGLNRRRNLLRRALGPLVDRFVTVSIDLRRWLIDTVRIPARKITTIANGVDTERFAADGRQEGRAALGVSATDFIVGTVGRLDAVKDQLGLIEAFARLPVDAQRTKLVIIGDGPCRASLEERARHPEIRGRVRLLGERADVPLLLKGLDVFTLSSIAEGMSNTILEAMATGLPVVATRTGGSPELVEDGSTGVLVPVGDRDALAAALLGYLRDPALRQRHGDAGRGRAVLDFGLPRMAQHYRTLYHDVAGEREG